MKKNILLSLSVILIVAVGALVYKNTATKTPQTVNEKWTRYENTQLGVALEYPSSKLHTTPEGSFGVNTVRIDNGDNAHPQMIIITIVPTDPTALNSVDDWIKQTENTNSPGGSPFANLKYDSIDGERVATYSDASNTEMLFFLNKQLHHLTIMNLSVSETDHVVKSLHFLK